MNTSKTKSYANSFKHIYVEEGVRENPIVCDFISHHEASILVPITHYKDIFNRMRQDFSMQKNSPSVIFAKETGNLLYKGSRMCQSFDNCYFYYTSMVKNCIFDCEYCYLQGMYPSAHLVVFVNIEDYFSQIDELLKEHPIYLCISYDTDLLALEGELHFLKKWCDFAAKRPNLTIEVRTKAVSSLLSTLPVLDNVIWAFTLSPSQIQSSFEHKTPSLTARIAAAKKAVLDGRKVRLCFDPILFINNYREIYSDFFNEVFDSISADCLLDVSLGLFRISAEYIKNMRKKRSCIITEYPYENINGMCTYDKERTREMLEFSLNELKKYISEDKIFQWDET